MICTSSYDNFNTGIYSKYSISGNSGKDVGYKGNCYPFLAPKIGFWREWKENKCNKSFEENTKFYIRSYWEQILSKLDPLDVFNKLDGSVLLCYEQNTEFCHRHIVAAWFEILLGEYVPEVRYTDHIEVVSRPKYIKRYLEYVMRLNRNMHGFNSLRALYLFEKSKVYASRGYKREACSLRFDAQLAEDEYLEDLKQKVLIKR